MRDASPEENLALKQIICHRIREKSKIPFSEFMNLCLYHPIHGYYNTEGGKIGKKGDYYTSPSVHPVFGRLIGRQLKEMDDLLGGGEFWVVEVGAGKGTLARDILDGLAEDHPPFFERLRYGIVETSSPFLEEQKTRLASHKGKVAWFDLQEVRKACFQGCLLANELIDAFPVHRVIVKNGEVREIYVTEKDGVFHEVLGKPSSDEIPRYLDDMRVPLEEGQQTEVNLEALAWYDQVEMVLSRGFVLIIDYGYLAQDLYCSDRRSGTLLCYYRHTASADPFVHVGLQDITAHVSFTSLVKKGESLGFHLTGLVPQYQFLLSLGFLDEIERIGQKRSSQGESMMEGLTMKRLILPNGGMGDTFKVLIQHKGLENVKLSGLRPL